MSESIVLGLKLTFIGMGIVYMVLALIALIVYFVRKIDDRAAGWEKREEIQAEQALQQEPTIDNLTLVLISAAVATTISGRHRIHSIHRVNPGGSSNSVWSMQGRSTLLGSHSVQKSNVKKF